MPISILAMLMMLGFNSAYKNPKEQPRPSKADYQAFCVAHLSYSQLPMRSEFEGKI